MTPAVIRRVEAVAVRGTERHWKLIPPELATRLRPIVERVGDGLLTLLPKSNPLRMNRVIGLGHRGLARRAMIDEIIARYRGAGLRRFSFLLSPGPQAAEITAWLRERDFEPHGGYTLLIRDARIPVGRPKRVARLRIARARRGDRLSVVRIIEECFATPRSRRSWSLAAVGTPGYEHYLAYVGRTSVAVGTLQVEGALAWLGGARRFRAGDGSARTGRASREPVGSGSRPTCRSRGQRDASRRNLVRLGFEQASLKPSFVWKAR